MTVFCRVRKVAHRRCNRGIPGISQVFSRSAKCRKWHFALFLLPERSEKMIITQKKPTEELLAMLEGVKKVAIVGCGSLPAVFPAAARCFTIWGT